jgi:beta-lactam-binding protein with PASTA domain
VQRAGVVVLLVGGAKPKSKPKPRPVAAPVATPTVIVTSVVGLPRAVAIRALLNEGLGVRIYGVPSRRPAGTVVAQSPKPGTRAEAGTYARINVAVN